MTYIKIYPLSKFETMDVWPNYSQMLKWNVLSSKYGQVHILLVYKMFSKTVCIYINNLLLDE